MLKAPRLRRRSNLLPMNWKQGWHATMIVDYQQLKQGPFPMPLNAHEPESATRSYHGRLPPKPRMKCRMRRYRLAGVVLPSRWPMQQLHWRTSTYHSSPSRVATTDAAQNLDR